MQVFYFDCFSGASGDMILGALADLGADIGRIEEELNHILPHPITINTTKKVVKGISATDIDIAVSGSLRLTRLPEIRSIIASSSLDSTDKALAVTVFERLAGAESRIHGVSVDDIHFHELGAVDTIVDIMGCIMALTQLGRPRIQVSPIPLATGTARMSHGIYPLPAPAVLELLQGIPCYGVSSPIELVTPTAAALLTSLSHDFGEIPPLRVDRTGYGAGKKERPEVPNLLRVITGTAEQELTPDSIAVIEANLDDMTPEMLGHFFETFFHTEGAVDLTISQVIMKKNRPGFFLQALVRPDRVMTFIDLFLNETSTLGARYRLENRIIVPRHCESVATRWGDITVKFWTDRNGLPRFAPEYESCRLLASQTGIPLHAIYAEVQSQILTRHPE